MTMNDLQNFFNMLSQVKQNFKGDPQQAVQQIIKENHISQNELNSLQDTANVLVKFMK